MKNKQFKVLHRSPVALNLPSTPPFTPKRVFVTSFTFEGVQTSQRLAHRGVLITSHMIIQGTLKWSMIASEKKIHRDGWEAILIKVILLITQLEATPSNPREVVRQNHQMSLFLRRSGRAGHAHRTSFALVGGSGVLFGVSPLDLTGRW